ncbi:MAG: carboxylating nicotinate-nucleotide diphosphorylase [Syntrophales bacterium]|jgi:nicotinate-nucleotide pyrophosphorylase (carboxylating)
MIPMQILQQIIQTALSEDLGHGDVTTSAILGGEETGLARAVVKKDLVAAGIDIFREVFLAVDQNLIFTEHGMEGAWYSRGDILAEIEGSLKSILNAERTALNILQRMCGIATSTRRFVEAVEGTGTKILDTRKTAPGLRALDKEAVRIGGGNNHRYALYDGVLIKENHIEAAEGIGNAVCLARLHVPHMMKIEVEVRNLEEASQALDASADVIMLDNMGLDEMKQAVDLIGGRAVVEASGNVNLDNVREIARTGVDFISVGALTHSVSAADVSLLVKLRR